ncbi:MAG: ATP phosphoribosyltransferase regulatory subunit [Myxococcales bacterium]|nr:ATP phosphoribosyltransferase regulatory subunit [Myxococcales bacterium]MCB9626638.1 ATP phosphoribosyltransferase regulatory subunit [Sandaracinaceae bacterium]
MPKQAPPRAPVAPVAPAGDELGQRTEGAGLHPDALGLVPPRGMRDIVPPTSAGLKRLRSEVMRVFGLYGYDRVITPPFELAEVLERGLDAVDRRELMRFVEPHSGEVALLRPDMTPQVARIVATRLSDRPSPHRLCYEGTVVRRMRHRARRRQQTLQAGIECIGWGGPEADVEVLRIADHACQQVGLRGHQLELAHVNIAATVLDLVPSAARAGVADALAQKDAFSIEARLQQAGVPAKERTRVLALTELYGDVSVLAAARKRFPRGPIADAIRELSEVVDRLSDIALDATVTVDLGELRGHSYYTGVSVTLLAEGPGAPVGTGGRYDALLARFGMPAPATGFAFDVDNLAWALRAQGQSMLDNAPLRVVVGGDAPAADALAATLRAGGLPAARVDGSVKQATAYAVSWSYPLVIMASGRSHRVVRVHDGETSRIASDTPDIIHQLTSFAHAATGAAL